MGPSKFDLIIVTFSWPAVRGCYGSYGGAHSWGFLKVFFFFSPKLGSWLDVAEEGEGEFRDVAQAFGFENLVAFRTIHRDEKVGEGRV